ncbi:DUF3626 domain-containing protein [Acidithiobacillus ferrivorans]|uniref:DUF3626 domain-containing protein n=1 Tax=Acidithiobacillus ferrivorans TaxID=160808 RepID=A0A7T5BHR1_9PROT|nr:DUF3626 domain-containing protein [Acidithiobacillus ferrivorans]QQD73644.1 DUF3626 domain-containing protein [Acidithiobacillus ferrivorans]
MALFSSKKKTYAQRNPAAAGQYAMLTPAQKQILDDFSYREHKNLKAIDRSAMQRIAEVYVIRKAMGMSEKQIKLDVQRLYAAAVRTLQHSEITTNVSAKLFTTDDFYNGDEVKTMWTVKTGKPHNYNLTRQAVEERAFGFKIDWNVPIREAAMTRPVYAGLNFTRHPYGAAAAYGSVVLVFKPQVLLRSTFIHTDTFDQSLKFAKADETELELQRNKICTYAQMGTLIVNMSENQLTALMQATEGKYLVTEHPPSYVEAHILGGVRWSRDLAEIRVALTQTQTGQSTLDREAGAAKRSLATMKYLISEFAKKHGVPAKIYHLHQIVEVLNA